MKDGPKSGRIAFIGHAQAAAHVLGMVDKPDPTETPQRSWSRGGKRPRSRKPRSSRKIKKVK